MQTHDQAIQKFMDAFNQNDIDAMAALCAVPCSILDGLPPHAWQGPSAIRDWHSDVMADASHQNMNYKVVLDTPLHNEVHGEDAYVVAPASLTTKIKDKIHVQSGAIFTLALHKYADGWRITAWAWAKGPKK